MKKLFATLALAITATILFAQTGEIQGRIIDPYDGGLAKARIAVVDSAGNPVKKLSATSDFAGDFKLTPLPAGTFNVQVALKNYTTQTQGGIIVTSDKPTFVNFRLQPANTLSK